METTKVKLTNTPDVKLWKIPQSEFAKIAKLYDDKQWPILGQLWNRFKVSPNQICNGCPWGVALVQKHMALIKEKYQKEIKPQEAAQARSLGEAKDEDPKKEIGRHSRFQNVRKSSVISEAPKVERVEGKKVETVNDQKLETTSMQNVQKKGKANTKKKNVKNKPLEGDSKDEGTNKMGTSENLPK